MNEGRGSFANALSVVIGAEGGYTNNPADPGNWTSGQCGVGRCIGTKYGISAASYPQVDIESLTVETASTIYKRDYWDAIRGDSIPAPLALLMFDAAINNGVSRSIRWLQQALSVVVDGQFGPATLAALQHRAGDGLSLLVEYQALRLTFMAGLPTWRTFGLGWARRLCRLPYQAMMMGSI